MTSDLTDLIHWSCLECLSQIGQLAEEREGVNGSKYKEMFKLKALHLLALFILVYVGVEVTIGGTSLAPSVPLILNTLHCRVDCHIYHSGSPWWPIIRIYIFRILWR